MKNITFKTFQVLSNTDENYLDRFELWEKYRQELTDIILSCSNNKEKKTISLLGVGNGDTIDLKKIYNNFSETMITDFDGSSMMRALKRFELEEKTNNTIHILRKKVVDYSGNKDEGLETNLVKELVDNTNHLLIIKKLESFLNKLDIKTVVKDIKKRDVVFSDCVIGQFAFASTAFEIGYLGHNRTMHRELDRFLLEEYYPRIVKHYNNLLLELTKPEGIIIFANDIAEISSDGYKKELHCPIMAIEDMEDKESKGKIKKVCSKNLIWNFTERKTHEVCVNIYKK